MHCEGNAIPRIDIRKWYNEPLQTSFPSKKLRDAIQLAKSDIFQLHSREIDLWKQSKKP